MKYCLASKNAIESNFLSSKLYRTEPKNEFSGWIIIGKTEDRSLFKKSLEQFEVIEIEMVEKYLPDFEAIKGEKKDSIFVHNEGFDKLIEINQEITQHLSTGAFATNQSNIQVDFSQWYRHVKKPLRKYYIWLTLFIILIPLANIIAGIAIFIIFARIRVYKDEIREYYKLGDTIPGIVTNTNPTMIAGMTNLSKGFGDYPVIKIYEFKTKKLGKTKISIGDKVPLTTVYYTLEDSQLDYWYDISSYPVEFATSNKNKIAEKIYSISALDWDRLEKKLEQLKDRTKPGLYKIDIENSDWIKAY